MARSHRGLSRPRATDRPIDPSIAVAEDARYLQKIHDRRFGKTAAYRNRVWQVLTRSFFPRWIAPAAVVLDLGCGYGGFINNIAAR